MTPAADAAAKGPQTLKPVVQRVCPFCSSLTFAAEGPCPSCGRFSAPEPQTTPRVSNHTPIIRKINDQLANRRYPPGKVERQSSRPMERPWYLNVRWRWAIAGVLLALGFLMGLIWLGPAGGTAAATDTLALTVAAIATLLGSRLLRSTREPAVPPTSEEPYDHSIRLLGYDINILLVQALGTCWMLLCIWQYKYGTASYLAFGNLALAALLLGTSKRWTAMLLALGSIMFLAHWFSLGPAQTREVRLLAILSGSPLPIDVGPVVSTIALVAAFPQLQLLSIGAVGPGWLRGDFGVRVFGTETPVALTTSVLLVSAWYASWAVVYAPRWVPYALSLLR